MRRALLARVLAAVSDAMADTQGTRPKQITAAGLATAAAALALATASVTASNDPLSTPFLATAHCSSSKPVPQAAAAAVSAAWAAIDEDLHRTEAALGALASFLLPPPRPPTISPDPDGSGHVRVSIPIRGGAAEPGAVLAACVAACGVGGAHICAGDGASAALTLTHTPRGDARAAVEVRVSPGGDAVEVRAWPADLATSGSVAASVLTAALRAANTVVRAHHEEGGGGGGGRSFSWSRSWSSDGEGPTASTPGGGMFELGNLLLRGPLEELLGGSHGGGEGGSGDSEERARRLRRPGGGGNHPPAPSTPPPPPPSAPPLPRSVTAAIADLERYGCTVTLPPSRSPTGASSSSSKPHWDSFAGYAPQKRQVEEAMLPLAHPDLCDGVAAAARSPAVLAAGGPGGGGASGAGLTRPRAVLFAGPPGCGKTTAAAIAAAAAGAPLVYVPVEAVVSKFYGEAEQRLAGVFEAARALAAGWGGGGGKEGEEEGSSPTPAHAGSSGPGKALVFLDEVDSLATSRGGGGGGGSDMHEATRRVLGVLLRALDGFAGGRGVVTVLATNRPEDCDPALLSRCGARIVFPLPDAEARAGIVGLYAAHLSVAAAASLAAAAAGLSGRALRDACEAAERAWAARLLGAGGGRVGAGAGGFKATPPPVEIYLQAVAEQKGRERE